MVDAVRTGYVTARSEQAYSRWKALRERADLRASKPVGLTGAALEQAIMALQMSRPEYVVVGARA